MGRLWGGLKVLLIICIQTLQISLRYLLVFKSCFCVIQALTEMMNGTVFEPLNEIILVGFRKLGCLMEMEIRVYFFINIDSIYFFRIT